MLDLVARTKTGTSSEQAVSSDHAVFKSLNECVYSLALIGVMHARSRDHSGA
jgi:hypothetical protein